MSCRDAVLDAFRRLERRHGRDAFRLKELVEEVRAATEDYTERTIRTHISSRMCANAPDHHGTTYDDLERLDRGVYRRRQSSR